VAHSFAPFAFRLDADSGVPVYRKRIDQTAGALASGDQLPAVRQVAAKQLPKYTISQIRSRIPALRSLTAAAL
jgi:hypothetical protein